VKGALSYSRDRSDEEAYSELMNELLQGEMRDAAEKHAPFMLSFSKYYTTDSVCKLVNFFEQIGLTQAHTHECAQSLATDVYNSKVANRLAFTIQQLMLREAQFSSVLEPWAFVNGSRGIEIDAPKLATASAFVYSKRYNFSYPWASMLIGLSEHYFSTTIKRTKEDLINVLIYDGFVGINLAVLYADKSKLDNLCKLTSIWQYDRHIVKDYELCYPYRFAMTTENEYNDDEENILMLETDSSCSSYIYGGDQTGSSTEAYTIEMGLRSCYG
jgi:hypothetical protein